MSKIICADSLQWLKDQESIPNVVTGVCDLDEMPSGCSIEKYLSFFSDIVDLIFSKLNDDCYAIFIQTDRKYNKRLIDKSYIITDIARKYKIKMIWHKIALHREVDKNDLYRPTYAHMLCYSRNGTTGEATPDVIPVGEKSYKNATSREAAKRALNFVKKYSKFNIVLDPFVGRGTIPLLAKEIQMDYIGIDIDPQQCEIAKQNLM